MTRKQKIAIIEDDYSIRTLYKYKLSIEGFDVGEASNGIEGLKLVAELEPDLILLDLLMPEMNGDEMLEQLRATEWGSKPLVIVLTNISRDEKPHSLRFLNVSEYIVKAHYTPSQIMDTIHKLLKESSA